MLATFKSDIRKLLTVRSTWVILGLALLLAGFMSFWIEGYKGDTSSAEGLLTTVAVKALLHDAAGTMAVFTVIVAILQVGHEYRYNTIMYTMTASNSRLKVFLSRMITMILFSFAFAAITLTFAIGSYFLGVSLRGASLPPQDFAVVTELLRLAAYFTVYSLFAYFLISLARNIIASIAVFFVLPSMIEPLLGLVLKENAKYLPMHAFDQVFPSVNAVADVLSPNKALLVSAIYLGIMGVAALVLFQKRDAN